MEGRPQGVMCSFWPWKPGGPLHSVYTLAPTNACWTNWLTSDSYLSLLRSPTQCQKHQLYTVKLKNILKTKQGCLGLRLLEQVLFILYYQSWADAVEREPSHLKPRCLHSGSWHKRWANFDKSEAPGDGQELRHPGGVCVHLVCVVFFLSMCMCCTFHQLCTISHYLSFKCSSLWVS